MTTIFDVRTRTVECSRCGAPIAAARQGGEVACRYCATVNVVATRAFDGKEGRALSLADEVARLTRLQAQLEHPLQGHAYDLRRAPAGFSEGDPARPDARDLLRRAWLEAKAATAGPGEPQRRLLWIALALAGAHRSAGDALQARAVLETVIGLLEDAGHRHLVRCRLADEALAEGDVTAAEGWLAECDPAPDVIELDGPHRAAVARVRIAKGDFEGALSVVGRRAADVPLEPSLRLPMAAVRIHALESLGQLDAAWTAFTEVQGEHGDARVRGALASGLAPRTLARARRDLLDVVARERDAVITGIRAAAGPLWRAPLFALGLLVLVTIPRCFFDADPFFGAQGYALCPSVCADCTGPFRIYTEWQHNGGDNSTDGPRYFCLSRGNGVAAMSDGELESNFQKLAPYEVSWAPAAATYLTLVLLLLPIVPVRAYRIHAEAVRRRAALSEQVAADAARLGVPEPPPSSMPSYARLSGAVGFFAASVVIPLLIVLIELSLHSAR